MLFKCDLQNSLTQLRYTAKQTCLDTNTSLDKSSTCLDTGKTTTSDSDSSKTTVAFCTCNCEASGTQQSTSMSYHKQYLSVHRSGSQDIGFQTSCSNSRNADEHVDKKAELSSCCQAKMGSLVSEIVCYGLGNFSLCPVARLQLCLLMLLVDFLQVSCFLSHGSHRA